MFRGTLEAIVRDRGSPTAQKALKEHSLRDALAAMTEDHTFTRELGDWATEVRSAGNAGAHVDPLDPVSRAEATNLAKLVGALLDYMYELPARLARTRS
jgi:hypothetical protein